MGLVPLFALLIVLAAPTSAWADEDCTFGAERGEPRPALSGPEQLIESADGRFLIHWTAEGGDTPNNLEDADENGVPDFADRALLGLVDGYTTFQKTGYRPVAMDDGGGGSDAVDVYILDLEANGYAFRVPAAEGAKGVQSCTIQLDGGLGDSLDGILESVAAHELHHCTQYAHSPLAPSWLLESSATFEQYKLYTSPALQAALEVLWLARLREPERPLADLGSRYEYAGFVFQYFWESFGGADPSRGPALWDALREAEGDWESALESESQRNWGQPFSRTFLDYSTWNAFACARDVGAHYDPVALPCELDTEVPVTEVLGDAVSLSLPWVTYAAAYAYVPNAGETLPLELTCDGVGPPGARARVRLLGLDGFSREVEVADATGRNDEPFTIRLEGEQEADGGTLVVLASTGVAGVELRCDLTRVNVVPPPPDEGQEGEGCGCAKSREPSPVSLAVLLILGLLPKRRRRRA